MSVVVPFTQELTLAWTPSAARDATADLSGSPSMKRASPSNSGSTVKKDSKKRRRGAAQEVVKREDPQQANEKKQEEDRDLHSDGSSDSNGEHKGENSSGAANYGDNDEYQWPALSRKRQRMTEDERKARHREVQRQFMQRKLAKLEEMRKLVVLLEKQYMLLQLSQERARLEHENDYLHRRVLANPPHWTHEHPEEQRQRLAMAMPMRPPPPPPPHPSSHAHPHSSVQNQRPHTGMLPWDEILEAVSEAANV